MEKIFNTYFSQKKIFIKHQLESYNYYIDHIVPSILSDLFPLIINYDDNDEDNILKSIQINIKKLHTEEPLTSENNGCSKLMTPYDARNRNQTYSLSLIVDFEVIVSIYDNNKNIVVLPSTDIKNIFFGKIPIMVGSKYCVNKNQSIDECIYDDGGYTIINGNEKVIVTQERVVPNIIQIFKQHKLTGSKYSHIGEVRSQLYNSYSIPKIVSIKVTNNSNIYNKEIYITISNIKLDIPIGILFKLLGCESDKEIIYYIIDNDKSQLDNILSRIMKQSLEKSAFITTKKEAINYLSEKLSSLFKDLYKSLFLV